MKNKRQFILDTLLPYKEDPGTTAYNDLMCKYLTKDGRKCAVGKHMKEGDWQQHGSGIEELLEEENLTLEDILTDEALEQNLTVKEWGAIQDYHDIIAKGQYNENILTKLEGITRIKFPELEF